jgi:ATP-dependent Clp protease protease subunit
MVERGLRVVVLLLVGGAAVLVSALALRLRTDLEDPYWLFQAGVDAQVEAGMPGAAIDPEDPLLRRRLIVITASINERAAAHVIPRLYYLSALDPRTPIELVVSTTGGWRDSAFAIIDAMRLIAAPVNTLAIGGCYSAGTLVVAGGTGTRAASSDALLMVHANLEDAREPFAQETRELAREERFWKTHARLPGDWDLAGGGSYYLTAEEAKEYGIVDVVRDDVRR